MFNYTHVQAPPMYPQEVHHHRAPTDDSIRLVKEYEEKAIERIVAAYRFAGDDNTVKGSVVAMNDPRCGMDVHVQVVFSINGIEYRSSHVVPGTYIFDQESAYKRLVADVSRQLACNLECPIAEASK